MSYLRYLCLFAHSGVQHIFGCVFVLSFLVLPISMDWVVLFSNFYCMTFLQFPIKGHYISS